MICEPLKEILMKQMKDELEEKMEQRLQQGFQQGIQQGMQSGIKAFYSLSQDSYFVPAWLYAYRKDFFETNHFEYAKGKYHEDYGLTIKVLLSSKTDLIVPTSIYNYYIRSNSIMTSKDREKNSKKAMDMLYFYDNMLLFLNDKVKDETKCLMVKSYLTNGLINNINNLNDDFERVFIDELKKRKIENNLLNNTFSRKCKKIICSINYKFYAIFAKQ